MKDQVEIALSIIGIIICFYVTIRILFIDMALASGDEV